METFAPVTILEYWRIVWRARLLVVALTILSAVAAFGWARMQPRVYTATATILPPKESAPQGMSMGLGALLGGTGGGREGGGGGMLNLPGGIIVSSPSFTTSRDTFQAVLTSRTMQEEVVAEFAKTWGPSVGSMIFGIRTNPKEQTVVSLTVDAKDPKLAADVANYYFHHLEWRLRRQAEESIKHQERFYRTQLEQAAREVEAEEAAVMKFQAENRVLGLGAGEGKGGGDTGGGLRSAVQGLEMQRELLRMRYTDNHSTMRDLDKQIAELKKLYSKNLFGTAMELPPEGPGEKGARKEFFVAAAKMTPVQFAFMKVLRNLQIQQAFYAAALQGLEQLKYGGPAQMAQRVEMLDPALPPGAPSRPNVRFIVLTGAVAGLVTSTLLAFVFEYLRRVREQGRQPAPRRAAQQATAAALSPSRHLVVP
jgi:uncharacterized protein involved in exopolysaccharide biosynthesis